MKNYIIIFLVIISSHCIAQKHQLTQFAENSIDVYYRPFVNDVQMIEVDINQRAYHAHVLEYVSRGDIIAYTEIPNPINLRQRDGLIIAVYNDDNKDYQKYIKLSVHESLNFLTYHNETHNDGSSQDMYYSEAHTFDHFVTRDFRTLRTGRGYQPYAKPSKGIYMVRKQNLIGVIDSNAKFILPMEYQNIIPFKYGYFVLKMIPTPEIVEEQHAMISLQWGFISKDLEDSIPCKYSSIECVDGTQFIVEKDNKQGILDKQNNKIVPLDYDCIIPTKNFYYYSTKGNATVAMGKISKDGLVTPWPDYSALEERYFFTNGKIAYSYFLVQTQYGYLLLDQYGNKLCDYLFSTQLDYNSYGKVWKGKVKDSLLLVGEKDIVLDSNFKEIKQHPYYYLAPMKGLDTLIGVLKNVNGKPTVKYGIKNHHKLVLDTIYDQIYFKEQVPNLYFAKMEGKYNIYYHHNGKAVFDKHNYLFFTIANSNGERAILHGTKAYIDEEVNGVKTRRAVRDCFEYTLRNGVQPIKCN